MILRTHVVSGGDYSAQVKIQRFHYAESASSVPHRVKFMIRIENRSDLVYTYTADNVIGSTVAIDWWDTNQSISSLSIVDGDGNSLPFDLSNYWDDINYKNRKVTVNNVNSDLAAVVEYPENVDWLFYSEHTTRMKDVSVAGSGVSYDLAPDTDF